MKLAAKGTFRARVWISDLQGKKEVAELQMSVVSGTAWKLMSAGDF